MLGSFLKAIYNLVCGGGESKPQYPSPQQQQQPQQHYQHHQHHQPQWQRPPESKTQHTPQKPLRRPLVQQPPYQTAQHGGVPYNKEQNVINQQNSYYTSLRSQANEEGDAMSKCFEESHQAYARREGALAKELSNKGREHQKRMEELNKKASEWIFLENNKDSGPHEIDLHGLYVKEAITYTDRALQQARTRGDHEIHLIVGKGLHSKNGAAKLKPAIEELMQKYQLSAELDPDNAGVLIVQLDSARGRGVGADEITRRIERSDEGCLIM